VGVGRWFDENICRVVGDYAVKWSFERGRKLAKLER